MTRVTRTNKVQTLTDLTLRGVFTSAAGSATLAVNDNGICLFTGSTATWTLPTPTGNSGNPIWIKNQGSGNLTVASASGSQIYTTSAQSTVTVSAGSALRLVCDGTYWNSV